MELKNRYRPQLPMGCMLIGFWCFKVHSLFATDDLDAAYQQLSQLVQEYLGLDTDTATGLAPPAGTVLATWCQDLCEERKTNR